MPLYELEPPEVLPSALTHGSSVLWYFIEKALITETVLGVTVTKPDDWWDTAKLSEKIAELFYVKIGTSPDPHVTARHFATSQDISESVDVQESTVYVHGQKTPIKVSGGVDVKVTFAMLSAGQEFFYLAGGRYEPAPETVAGTAGNMWVFDGRMNTIPAMMGIRVSLDPVRGDLWISRYYPYINVTFTNISRSLAHNDVYTADLEATVGYAGQRDMVRKPPAP